MPNLIHCLACGQNAYTVPPAVHRCRRPAPAARRHLGPDGAARFTSTLLYRFHGPQQGDPEFIDCYICGLEETGDLDTTITRRVVAIGDPTGHHADPTTVYGLDCGHTVI